MFYHLHIAFTRVPKGKRNQAVRRRNREDGGKGAQRQTTKFDFEITRMISDQIAVHSVQLPLLISARFHQLFRLVKIVKKTGVLDTKQNWKITSDESQKKITEEKIKQRLLSDLVEKRSVKIAKKEKDFLKFSSVCLIDKYKNNLRVRRTIR